MSKAFYKLIVRIFHIFTKLISNGWTISDNLYRGFNLFAEAMYSPFYWVFDNTLILLLKGSFFIICESILFSNQFSLGQISDPFSLLRS